MEVNIRVEGMSCQHCKASVTEGLSNLNGVNNVKVHLDSGLVDVNFDETTLNLEKIEKEIEDLGYDVVK